MTDVDEPDVDDDGDLNVYYPSLSMRVDAATPEEAVMLMIEKLTSTGLRNWVYEVYETVTDAEGLDDDSLVGQFNGYGENMASQIAELKAEQDAAPAAPATPASPADATPGSTDDLLALAEGLNAG